MNFELEELRHLQELGDRQLAAARRRVDDIENDGAGLSFEATSDGGDATVRVTSTGVVTNISLASGFGDLGQPAWLLADDVDKVCVAIVQAVGRARSKAAEEMRGRFAQAFPDAYELLDDLRDPRSGSTAAGRGTM
ncbi:YbaB/EbfC family nucleoid-associated protein [Nocardia shimofusensis]|uniref:YbaB/EbfC family nucleoid-associated protein n=1 Tax=Nocardia shimofusensis TaxID=228596 RepID=UPI00082FB61D|nr:YbaB/EbfC family nucleoid-associated protein [Nocardia shimofusensis]